MTNARKAENKTYIETGKERKMLRKKSKSREKMSEGDREKELGARPSSSIAHTYIPSTSPSLHYLHVNDSSLCPAEGRKGLLTPQHMKPKHCFQPTQSTPSPSHSHTYIHTLIRAHTVHSWARERRADAKKRWAKDGHSVEFLICCTKAEAKDEITYYALIVGGCGLRQPATCLVGKSSITNQPALLCYSLSILHV